MKSIDLSLIEARFRLELISSDELPDIAAEVLASGLESRSLIELASLSLDDTDDAGRLFHQALAELGRGQMSQEAALRHLTKDVSLQILERQIKPYDGAKLIWQYCRRVSLPETHEFDPFIYAASEMEDRPRHKSRFENGILEEAKSWAARDL